MTCDIIYFVLLIMGREEIFFSHMIGCGFWVSFKISNC